MLKHGFIIGLAALAAVFAAMLLGESRFMGARCCLASWPQSDPLQAERLLAAADPDSRDFRAQRRAALGVLDARPADPSGWVRLAYADRLEHGRLTAQGLKALDNSYSAAVYAGGDAAWRLQLALDNWSALPVRSREDALTELDLVRTDWPQLRRLTEWAPRLTDPNGRIVAALQGLTPSPASGS